jgi:hypothetical protein
MRKLRIETVAAKWICDNTHEWIEQRGPDLIPCIVWINGDSEPEAIVPRLGVGLAEPGQVQGRMLECDNPEYRIAQLVPDDILEESKAVEIAIRHDSLVLVRGV